MAGEKVREERRLNAKKNEILKLLSQAWLLYSESFPGGKNFEAVLEAISQAQLAVFEEE